MITAFQIVRCVKRDYGTRILDLQNGASYCQSISVAANLNPFGDAADAPAYAEAAKLLTTEADERLKTALERADKES